MKLDKNNARKNPQAMSEAGDLIYTAYFLFSLGVEYMESGEEVLRRAGFELHQEMKRSFKQTVRNFDTFHEQIKLAMSEDNKEDFSKDYEEISARIIQLLKQYRNERGDEDCNAAGK